MAVGICTGCNHLFVIPHGEASCPRCDRPMRGCEREELLARLRAREGQEQEPREPARAASVLSPSPAGQQDRGEAPAPEWMTGPMVVRCQALVGEAQQGRVELRERLRQCRELRGELHRLVEELQESIRTPPAAHHR